MRLLYAIKVLEFASELSVMAAFKLIGAVTALALLPISHACLREREFHNYGLEKRSVTPRAELSVDEQFIVDSFDNNSISDWSYYYTHGIQTQHDLSITQFLLTRLPRIQATISAARTNHKPNGPQTAGQRLD